MESPTEIASSENSSPYPSSKADQPRHFFQRPQSEIDSPSRIAATRKSRTRNWPARSDPHRQYPSLSLYKVQLGDVCITIDSGADSGRNLLAIFEDIDEEPRLAFNIRCQNGRSKSLWPKFKSVKEAELPVGTTLKQICRYFPLHVWGDGMRIFMAEGWTAEQIWKEIPAEARNAGAATRPWNYLQQAMGREADKMYEEGGHGKRVPMKRKKVGTEEDGDGDGNGDSDSAEFSTYRDSSSIAFEDSPSGITDCYLSPGTDESSLGSFKRSTLRSGTGLSHAPISETQRSYPDDRASPRYHSSSTFVSEYGSPRKRQRFCSSNPGLNQYMPFSKYTQGQFRHMFHSSLLSEGSYHQIPDIASPTTHPKKVGTGLYPGLPVIVPSKDVYERQTVPQAIITREYSNSLYPLQYKKTHQPYTPILMRNDPFDDQFRSSASHGDASGVSSNMMRIDASRDRNDLSVAQAGVVENIHLQPNMKTKSSDKVSNFAIVSSYNGGNPIQHQNSRCYPQRVQSSDENANATTFSTTDQADTAMAAEPRHITRFCTSDATGEVVFSSPALQMSELSECSNTSGLMYNKNWHHVGIKSPVIDNSFSDMLFDGVDLP